ncbi:hypothetical protein SEA_COLUCCI_63 [Arthrobacter phage Colucci]|uniref:Uncharacterized protein n=1 Tax=Arthrobacter phage Colucci TaxID=2015834 RepID=A0A286N2X5_9CAUD|nr:hypothetical protein FDI27_gp063 [Arthrobacter phage Colucci]ASX98732.1 hypothetical protein SEA_COLUCCI_63 [Arthrobacter phage Colucci]
MSSLTDPKGIKRTVAAIYYGGREHPLANLARLIDGAISDAQFQGLGQFDVARWVAHAITEDQKARVAEADKTAPHGQFVRNPPAPTPGDPEHRAAAQALRDALPKPGLWDFLKDLPTIPDLDSVRTPGPHKFEDFKPGFVAFGEMPELPPFPKLDLSGIPAMPVDIKESLERASEQLRESMERAAKAVRKGIDDARAAEARRILAAQPHEHIYGRGSNGLCRICGAESNSRRARAKRREINNTKAKAAAQYPRHAVGERVTHLSTDSKGTVLEPADHNGKVQVIWDTTGNTTAVYVNTLSAPESRLYEALKNKGDGVDG